MTKEEMEEYTTLDTNQCKWWANHLFNIAKEKAFNANVMDDAKEIQSAQDKIIKVLEQEPCEDAISRKELLKKADCPPHYICDNTSIKCGDCSDRVIRIQDVISAPSVAPTIEPKWITVSKELPKCNGVYEVTIQTDNGRYTSACYFDGSDTWYNDNRINHMRTYVTDKVIAWMPKPEPYNASETPTDLEME